jgi:hypothetical protein
MGQLPTGTRALHEKTEPKGPILKMRSISRSGRKEDGPVKYYRDMDQLNELIDAQNDHTFDLVPDSHSGSLNVHPSAPRTPRFSLIRATSVGPVSLKNLLARLVVLKGGQVSIENAQIFDLRVHLSKDGIVLKNCTVGTLALFNPDGQAEIERIYIENCKILSLRLPRHLTARDVEIQNVEFISTYEKDCKALTDTLERRPILDRASFGFLHDWAVKAGNSEIAHLARGNELAIERRTATKGLERFILSLWSIFGNFGLSPMRPIIWMFVAMIAMCVILFCTGTSLSIPADELVGWRNALQDTKDYSGALARAAAGTLEGGVSPLSVFSSRRMVIPNSGWIAGLQVLYGYFCIAMFLLFGFSVRRRFKIS